MKRDELFKRFKKLGWGDDPQSMAIFNFLMDAKEQILPDTILLDLGGGQCRYSFFFEHCNYLSVDFGKGDTQWDFSNLDFVGDITRLHFIKDEAVDFCLNTTTLEHISEPSLFFSEVRRILKPGGRLFLYVPFVMSEHQTPYDFFRYTSYGLRHLCDTNGLKVVSVDPSNGPLYTGIRWAYITLRGAKANNYFIKLLIKSLRYIFKSLLIPLFDYLEVYSKDNNFPQCWLLTAEKAGLKQECNKIYKNKQQIVQSIIQCSHCRDKLNPSAKSYTCCKCKRTYPVVNGQIIFLEQ